VTGIEKTMPLAAALLLATAATASAQQTPDDAVVAGFGDEAVEVRRYTVEVVIFDYAESVSAGTEVFVPDPPPEPPAYPDDLLREGPLPDDSDRFDMLPEDPAASSAEAASEPLPDDPDLSGPAVEVVLLGEEELAMEDAIRKFELLDAYETIMHFGWTQTVFADMDPVSLDLAEFGNVRDDLEGTLTLYLSRFLHLEVDLAMTQEAPPSQPRYPAPTPSFSDGRAGYDPYDPEPAGVVRYRIREDRIFKNGDLRYFDHPRFGVLARVTRVEESEPDLADPLLESIGTD